MSDYPERLRNFNKAGQLQYEWFNEVADHIEGLEAKLTDQTHMIAQLFALLDVTEETEDGRVFHPNQVRSSRMLDAEKLDALLAELRDTLAELKGQ